MLLNSGGKTVAMVSFEAKITRADGTVEHRVLARSYRSPFRQWAFRFWQWLRGESVGRITGA